jgi:nucleotide-binding universal stress UspA family protein
MHGGQKREFIRRKTMFQEIVVATDGSDHALQAARMAGEIAQKFQAKLTLLSVFDMAGRMTIYESGPENMLYVDALLRRGQEMHENVQRRTGEVLQEMGVPYQSRREAGHAVDTIVQVAEELKADLIVLGSRGLGGFKRFLMGSVSDGVLHHAHCPVLVVR